MPARGRTPRRRLVRRAGRLQKEPAGHGCFRRLVRLRDRRRQEQAGSERHVQNPKARRRQHPLTVPERSFQEDCRSVEARSRRRGGVRRGLSANGRLQERGRNRPVDRSPSDGFHRRLAADTSRDAATSFVPGHPRQSLREAELDHVGRTARIRRSSHAHHQVASLHPSDTSDAHANCSSNDEACTRNARTAGAGSAPRAARRRSDHRVKRHRWRHSLHAAASRGKRAESRGCSCRSG